MKAVKRDKALAGTAMAIAGLISTLVNAGSQIYNAKKNKQAIQEANQENLFAQNFGNAMNQQQNLRAVYNNPNELDLLQQNTILPTINQFACGGRKMRRK